METIRDLLIRCVTDGKFLDHLKKSPADALQGYSLDDRQREILLSRDARVLDLLGEACLADESSDLKTEVKAKIHRVDSLPKSAKVPIAHAASRPMDETTLAVRIVPYAARAADSSIQLNYTTHIDGLQAGQAWETLPVIPVQQELGQHLPWLPVQVVIRPRIVQTDAGEAITFDVHPSASLPSLDPSPGAEANQDEAVRQAVAAVHEAGRETRKEKLLNLIALLEDS